MEFERDYRIERQPGRVSTDLFPHTIGTNLLHNQGKGENLGNRLDSEGDIGIAGFKSLAVRRHHGQTEQVGRNRRQEWNIVGILAAGCRKACCASLLKSGFDRI